MQCKDKITKDNELLKMFRANTAMFSSVHERAHLQRSIIARYYLGFASLAEIFSVTDKVNEYKICAEIKNRTYISFLPFKKTTAFVHTKYLVYNNREGSDYV